MLGLSLIQDVLVALALQHSQNTDIASRALDHIQKQLPELVKNYVDANDTKNVNTNEEGLHDASPEVLHQILTFLFEEDSKICLNPETKDKFLKYLRRDFPREVVPIVLAPLLYPGSEEDHQQQQQQSTQFNMAANQLVRHFILYLSKQSKQFDFNRDVYFFFFKDNTNYAELIMELGYSFTSSVEECRKSLTNFGGRDLTARCVAKILSFMARTSGSIEDNALGLHSFWENSTTVQDNKDKISDGVNTWNVEVFVKAVSEVVIVDLF